jgi:AraC-like DNA-binding protein
MRQASVMSAPVARAILAGVSPRGCEAGALLARLGISRDDREDVWPLAKFTAALEAAAIDKGDALLGLALGKTFRLSGLGPVSSVMRASSCAAEAFTKFTKYYPAFQNNTHYGFSVSGDIARLSYAITDPSITQRRQDADFTIAMEQSVLSELLGFEARPTCIDFQHMPADKSDVAGYRALLNCEVRFGRQENAIYLPRSYFAEASRHADALVSERAESELARSICADQISLDFSSAIEGWMASAISSGQGIEIENAASDFGMSLRSFQRKLAENGINYLDLRNQVRSEIGRCLLDATTTPVTSIALYLGYSETSAFSRHFKRVNGISPLQYRDRSVS